MVGLKPPPKGNHVWGYDCTFDTNSKNKIKHFDLRKSRSIDKSISQNISTPKMDPKLGSIEPLFYIPILGKPNDSIFMLANDIQKG
jgi:hypothetical protein